MRARLALVGPLLLALSPIACSSDSTGPADPGDEPAPTVDGTYSLVSVNAAALPASLGTNRIDDWDSEVTVHSGALIIGQNADYTDRETQSAFLENVVTGATQTLPPTETVRNGVYTIDGVNLVFVSEVSQAFGDRITGIWNRADNITVTRVSGLTGETDVRNYRR